MSALSILFLGDAMRSEFRAARAELDTCGDVLECSSLDAAMDAIASGRVAPDVVIVAKTFPGEFAPEAVERLRRAAPLARFVALLGSWCEGEMRSGRPWPSSMRAYWHQWPARGHRELSRLVRGEPCGLALPPTAEDEERLLADVSGEQTFLSVRSASQRQKNREDRQACPSSLLVIRTPSHEMWSWLAEMCQSQGAAAVWQREATPIDTRGATAAIFDATDLGPCECEQLRRFSTMWRPAPTVVLLSFPRIDQVELAQSCGAAAVLSKPMDEQDFWETLGELERRSACSYGERGA